jgi:drug/metabolite transporter (DMT)-like permease
VAIALALTASLFWGVGDFLGGSLSRRHPLLVVVLISQVVGLLGIAAVAALHSGAPPAGVDAPGALAGIMGVIGILSFYRAMTIGAISVAAPILASSVAIPVVAGLIHGERPAAIQLAGIASALAGVVLVSREPAPDGGTVRGAGVPLAVLAAAALGVQLIAIDHAARADALWSVGMARITSVSIFAVAALVLRPVVAAAALAPIAVAGAVDVAANASFALATRHGYLSIVAVLSSLYPLVTVGLAHRHLHERLSPGQRVGVVLAVGGAMAIAVG